MQIEKVNVVAKPPAIYAVSILSGILLQIIWPLTITSFLWVRVLGLIMIGLAVALSIWADQEFKQHDTAVNPDQLPTSLVMSGPYRLSRNPMYVGLTLFQLGLALSLNSLWLVLTMIPTLLVMSYGVIDREEHFMAAKFGQNYSEYKNRVRRWF